MTLNKYTTVSQEDGEWWIGWVEELPGANTQGRTRDEAHEYARLQTKQKVLEQVGVCHYHQTEFVSRIHWTVADFRAYGVLDA